MTKTRNCMSLHIRSKTQSGPNRTSYIVMWNHVDHIIAKLDFSQYVSSVYVHPNLQANIIQNGLTVGNFVVSDMKLASKKNIEVLSSYAVKVARLATKKRSKNSSIMLASWRTWKYFFPLPLSPLRGETNQGNDSFRRALYSSL